MPVCDPNPCQNRGTCKVTGPGTYSCECWPGYTGKDCGIGKKGMIREMAKHKYIFLDCWIHEEEDVHEFFVIRNQLKNLV